GASCFLRFRERRQAAGGLAEQKRRRPHGIAGGGPVEHVEGPVGAAEHGAESLGDGVAR
ncbi:unnamed protein product, partial [Prorocentrum cordatum]